jgi:hypothetical protein
MVLEHTAYSSHVAPCDSFTIPTTRNHFKGSHFETVEEIQKVMMAILTTACRKMISGSASTVGNHSLQNKT